MKTPYYLIDEEKLQKNLEVVRTIQESCGAKSVLALKCFSTWRVFDLMRKYLAGTTSSSLFEARLGYEKFGKEVHAYSVGFSDSDIKAVRKFADKVIFNSTSQLLRYHDDVHGLQVGLRINPGISYSHYDLADPVRRYSRLGVANDDEIAKVAHWLSGLMFHFNCENGNVEHLIASIEQIGKRYATLLSGMAWVSFGGGIAFTQPGYPLDQLCAALKTFSQSFGVQVYLEPGDAIVSGCAELVTTVVDVVHNEMDIAIVDASVEAHMLDHLVYRTSPRLSWPEHGDYKTLVAGRTCLAGDVFGEYSLQAPLTVGDEVRIADAAGYTMVKKNWFNGVSMPSIVVKRLNGQMEQVRSFGYADFKRSLS